MTLRSRRVFFVVLVVVGVVLSASLFAGFQAYKNAVAEDHRDEVDQMAEQVASELDARLAGHRQTVSLWTATPALTAHGTAEQRAALVAFVEQTPFAGVSVVAANGTMTNIVAGLSSAERRGLVGGQFGNRTYVQRALAGETYVSDPVAAASGNVVVTVSAPVVRDGEVVAALNAAFHVSEATFFERATTGIGEQRGVVVSTNGGRTVYERPAAPNTSLVVEHATVDETEWTVSVSESRAVIQPAIRRVTALQFGAVSVVVVSLAAFGWWNYRRNLQQVERLLDGFEALEGGEYGVRVGIGGAAEWERIGDGFNEMSETVEASLAGRRERARQLQVVDRLLRHNLRNDLNVVRGRAELLLDDGPGDLDEHATAIIERCEDLLATARKERIINEVMNEETATERVEVVAAVGRAVDDVLDDRPDATVTVDAPEAVHVSAVARIETAVSELVENAVEHGDADTPSVTVSVETNRTTATVAVADDGPGLPAVEREVRSGEIDIDALHHSQGLGLWVVYWVAERSGGRLTFEDNDPCGSVITVELPLADE
jgi:signal transduction histidine kinase